MIPNYYQWDIDASHRCEGSVNSNCSVLKLRRMWENRPYKWWMVSHVEDLEYGCFHHRLTAIIRYCPWCGKELEVMG